ncbi:MAG: PHP domain-containing protein [Christensenellales bacterium]
MRLNADYHTHTVYSHGKGSVKDNVKAAIERGLETVGIADHCTANFMYGIKRRNIDKYIAEIDSVKRLYDGLIDIKTGIELNLTGLDGSVDMPCGKKFDIVIMGYHKAVIPRDFHTLFTFASARFWEEKITRAYMRAVQRNDIDILAHAGYGVPVNYEKVARACADYGTLFEINNKHGELTADNLRAAAGTSVRFVVSSDAHRPENVGLAQNALSLIEHAGLSADSIINVTEVQYEICYRHRTFGRGAVEGADKA